MTWFLFFVFSVVALNSVIIWGLLKKAGFEDTTLLLLSGLCLLSACLMYNSAIGGDEEHVYEIRQEHTRN